LSLGIHNIDITHLSDRALLDTIANCATLLKATVESIFLYPITGGEITIPKDAPPSAVLEALLKANSELINSARFHLIAPQAGAFNITFSRLRDKTFDRLNLDFQSIGQPHVNFVFEAMGIVRTEFKAVDGTDLSKLIQEDYGKYVSHREETLARLEKTMTSLIVDQEKYRKNLEDQYQKRIKELEKTFSEKEKDLLDKGSELSKRIAEVDDREAKHARRATRESLKEIFKKRGESFRISSGTIELRKPINYFSIALLLFFGTLFTIAVLTSLKLIGSATEADMTGLYIKQITLGLAFASSAVFYIRWRNHWFERHAYEEFAIKRQEIDLDRATWAVELASEWVEEKKKDIPESLLNKITTNLFEHQKIEDTRLHPADELASALFGASSKVKMKLTNGTEIDYDRKGIKQLQETI